MAVVIAVGCSGVFSSQGMPRPLCPAAAAEGDEDDARRLLS